MLWAPHVTVAAVIEHDGRFLMVEELDAGTRVLNQPAGHLEPGESLLQAVEREVHEETACRFAAAGLVGVYRWQMPNRERTYLRFCFAGKVGAPDHGCALDPDILAVHWLPLEQIRARQLRSPLVLRCLEDALRRPWQPLELLQDVA
jgi:ADP-ribose pyrophosphatase YjhB (NUDIX family)